MKDIYYIKGDATKPTLNGNKIIAHICNNAGVWGAGFVIAISKVYKKPEEEYLKWHENKNGFGLGAVQFVDVGDGISIANMVAQDNTRDLPTGIPLCYDSLEKCLLEVARYAIKHSCSVHMPRIGCGIAGGRWEMVEPIIIKTLSSKNIAVYVYDLL